MGLSRTKECARLLENLYGRLNRRDHVPPDPLQFLYAYPDRLDREVAGLVASCLAYGRVAQINRTVGAVLAEMGRHPRRYVETATVRSLRRVFGGFAYRFTTGGEFIRLLSGAKRVVVEYGSLGSCFTQFFESGAPTVRPALAAFARALSQGYEGEPNSLLPCVEKGSACKRMNLYLRWMAREDAVDPGGWGDVPPAKLIVPLDTHMFMIGRLLGLVRRKQPNMAAAVELSEGFGQFTPEDPVRYDFSLTRLGMRNKSGLDAFCQTWANRGQLSCC